MLDQVGRLLYQTHHFANIPAMSGKVKMLAQSFAERFAPRYPIYHLI